MLGWLKKVLRHWLMEEDKPDRVLECLVFGKGGRREIVKHHITGTHGILLVGTPLGPNAPNQGIKLIGEHEAVCRNHFWALWESLNDRKLQWEDGQKFSPPT